MWPCKFLFLFLLPYSRVLNDWCLIHMEVVNNHCMHSVSCLVGKIYVHDHVCVFQDSLCRHFLFVRFLSHLSGFSDSWFLQCWFEEHASGEFKEYYSSHLAFIKLYCSQILQSPTANCKSWYACVLLILRVHILQSSMIFVFSFPFLCMMTFSLDYLFTRNIRCCN